MKNVIRKRNRIIPLQLKKTNFTAFIYSLTHQVKILMSGWNVVTRNMCFFSYSVYCDINMTKNV